VIRWLLLSLSLVPLACSSCRPLPTPTPIPEPVPPPMADAGPAPAPPPNGDLCQVACAHLRALGCPASAPTPAGTSCEDVCASDRAESAARLTDRYLGCLATMAACRDDEKCPR
jgi:hypothetical protein